jgi:hypothetical protein
MIALKNMQRRGATCGLATDGWMSIDRTHFDGWMIIAGGAVAFLDRTEAGTSHDGLSVARSIEAMMAKAVSLDLPVGSVCTDDAAQCARARRILELRHHTLVFMRCQAHQFNLYLKDILKCEAWATAMRQACSAASALVASSNKWLARLQEIIVSMYGRALAIIGIADTRWNSIQMCLASQMRVRGACKRLVDDYKSDPTFPSACTVYADPTFWVDVEAAELASRPLVEASFAMQKDATTMADVVNALGHVYRNSVTSANVLAALEKRWQAEEHPLFLLAFLFHPQTADACRLIVASNCDQVYNLLYMVFSNNVTV